MDYNFGPSIVIFICSLVFYVLGYFQAKYPELRINIGFGYRTWSSTKSKKHWDFAQKKSAIELKNTGVLGTIISLIILGLNINPQNDLPIILSTLFGLAGLIFVRVEMAIYRKFKTNL